MRILGLDPGLQHTGWGLIEARGSALKFVACGRISPPVRGSLAARLQVLHQELTQIIETYSPTTAAIEETFVNQNPVSALKLGQARGVVLMTPAACGLEVAEYGANKIKKSVVGVGHADKTQVMDMVKRLLPLAEIGSEDAADALAVAICHAHHAQMSATVAAALGG